MDKNFLFAGASSAMALKASKFLIAQGDNVIGLSTKENIIGYSEINKIKEYRKEYFPKINNQLNGLVYFPGTINLKPFTKFSEDEFQYDYTINALGAAQFIQHYLPQLIKGNSSIVLISSIAVQHGFPYHSSIAMAKGAIEGLTRSLAAELAPSIRVNAIAPSLTQTTLTEKFINSPEKIEASIKRNPLKAIGQPNQIAELISFLLTEKSSWITGQIISIDGGASTIKI